MRAILMELFLMPLSDRQNLPIIPIYGSAPNFANPSAEPILKPHPDSRPGTSRIRLCFAADQFPQTSDLSRWLASTYAMRDMVGRKKLNRSIVGALELNSYVRERE
jgi:hypothetical protein